jgi:hypothetical protein
MPAHKYVFVSDDPIYGTDINENKNITIDNVISLIDSAASILTIGAIRFSRSKPLIIAATTINSHIPVAFNSTLIITFLLT